MKVFGIILVVMELIAMTQGIPGLGEGNISVAGLAETLGYLAPGILGVYLITRANKKKNRC